MLQSTHLPFGGVPDQIEFEMRIMLVGDASVGKTSIFRRFVNDDFSYIVDSTIGIDLGLKTMKLGGGGGPTHRVRLQVWDTGGQERFQAVTRQYYYRGQGFLLVYDVTQERSIFQLQRYVEAIRENSRATAEPVIALVANKCDDQAQRQVSRAWGMEFARKHGLSCWEVSARTGTNVRQAFEDVAARILTQHQQRGALQELSAGGASGDGGGDGGAIHLHNADLIHQDARMIGNGVPISALQSQPGGSKMNAAHRKARRLRACCPI